MHGFYRKNAKAAAAILAVALTFASGCAADAGKTTPPAENRQAETVAETSAATAEAETNETKTEEETTMEETIPALKDCVEAKMGCRFGCAITATAMPIAAIAATFIVCFIMISILWFVFLKIYPEYILFNKKRRNRWTIHRLQL